MRSTNSHRRRGSRILGRLVLAAALAALVLGGCTKIKKLEPTDPILSQGEAMNQMEYQVKEYIKHRSRVNRVAWPVLQANSDLCKSVAPRLGLWAASIEDIPSLQRNAFATIMHTDQRLTAIDVFPGGPADKAGMQQGDVILTVNGDKAPEGFDASDRFNRLLAKHMAKSGAMTFGLERKGQPLTAALTAERACGPNVFLVNRSDPNAYADGNNIFIHAGLLRFLDNDDELASIIAHELAHNEMGHITAKIGNARAAATPAVFIAMITGVNLTSHFARQGAKAYSQEFEHEADYVGLYYMARAGFDITFVPDAERKFATLDPKGITIGSSHPPSAERFVAMEAAVKEIQAKQAAGQPLKPEMQPQ